MMNSIIIKVLKKKLVKPCTPTPPNLKTYQLSFTDRFLPTTEVGAILFYSSNHDGIELDESLAKVLVRFYPLAGRFVFEDQIIDCSDQGAEFVEAEAPEAELASLIEERNLENLLGFLPRHHQRVDDASDYPILSIKITRLPKCGGVVIGISVSHKVFDGSSMATFLAAWSNATTNPSAAAATAAITINPSFHTALLFPPPGKNQSQNPNIYVDTNISVKRFSFDEKAIICLRSNSPNPMSRVRAVSALISRVLIGVDRAKCGRFRDCLITNAVNMRERTLPPIHKHTCGNLVLLSVTVCHCSSESESESEAEGKRTIQELADLIGEATKKSVSECSEVLSLSEDERNNMLMNPMKNAGKLGVSGETNTAFFSDYTKFGLYEADFGWGKPVWVSIVPQPGPRITVLMNNKEGNGIEAWVHLEKKDMPLFEEDVEIQMFAT